MQGRSWMAALALAAASAAFFGTASLAGQPTPIKQTVKLSLHLEGIAREDGEVVIKPGHPGCRFKEIAFRLSDQPLDGFGMINLAPFEVETISADRDCCVRDHAQGARQAGQDGPPEPPRRPRRRRAARRPAEDDLLRQRGPRADPGRGPGRRDEAEEVTRPPDRRRSSAQGLRPAAGGSRGPGRRLTKAIDWPSGDQAGSRSPSGFSGKGRTVPRSRSRIRIAPSGRPRPSTKATRRPSGLIEGLSSRRMWSVRRGPGPGLGRDPVEVPAIPPVREEDDRPAVGGPGRLGVERGVVGQPGQAEAVGRPEVDVPVGILPADEGQAVVGRRPSGPDPPGEDLDLARRRGPLTVTASIRSSFRPGADQSVA